MAKHAQPSDTASTVPVSAYSTRSSLRRSLNLKTNMPSDQHSTDLSTPCTSSIDLSTDLQKSPASSQTSSNIIESSLIHISPPENNTMPPKAKTNKITKGVRAKNTPTPDTTVQTTETKSDRPGRTRKPTQKAAEFAASQSSKLFKSGKERQLSKDIDEDENSEDQVDEEVEEEERPRTPLSPASRGLLVMEGTDWEALNRRYEEEWKAEAEAEPSFKETAATSAKQKSTTKPVRSTPIKKTGRKTGSRKAAKSPIPGPKPAVSRKRKRVAESEDPEEALEEAPSKKTKVANTRVTRSVSKTPAPETVNTVPVSTSISNPTRSTRKRKEREEPEESEEPEAPPQKKTRTIKAANTRTTRLKTKPPAIETTAIAPTPDPTIDPTRPTKRRKRNITTTNSEPQPAPPFPIPNPTTNQNPSPPRIKFKPLKPTLSSAREGFTGLPCALSCLEDDSILYMWATIAVEHEKLADEVCNWPGGFEGDFSGKACAVRRRWNEVLGGWCVCGGSEGSGGVAGEEGEGEGRGKGGKEG